MGSKNWLLGTNCFWVPAPWAGKIPFFGETLPAAPKPSDFDLGVGIQVTKVVGSTPTEAALQISVAPKLPVGVHDVSVHGVTAVKAFTVYDKVDYIKVIPDAVMPRLGGSIAAKQLQPI